MAGMRKFGRLRGSSVTGYSLVLGLIAILALAATASVGRNLNGLLSRTSNTLGNVVAGTAGTAGQSDGGRCFTVGQICPNGSVYVGLTPDGNKPLYVMPCDYGMSWDGSTCTGTRSGLSWGYNLVTAASSSFAGYSNTQILVGIGPQYQPANYCWDLVAYGFDDWYLPALDELQVLWNVRNSGVFAGNFDLSNTRPNGWYTTSTDWSFSNQRYISWGDGTNYQYSKGGALAMRCMRHD